MRLVVWNCHHGLTTSKWGRLASLQPDVAVILEAQEGIEWATLGERSPSEHLWQGLPGERGTAVLSFGDWSVRLAHEFGRVPWVLPVEVSGPASFLLLAIWTIQRKGSLTYAGQVAAAIEAYEQELSSGRVVIAGDLNCSAQTANPRAHLRNVARLEELGMESAYHAFHGVEQGQEPTGTLYWRWSASSPFHCDQIFLPSAWKSAITAATAGTFDEWVGARVSDHVPVVVDLDDPLMVNAGHGAPVPDGNGRGCASGA